MTPLKLVILDPLAADRFNRFNALVPAHFVLETAASRAPADQLAAICQADFAITGDVAVTAEMMRSGAAAGLRAVHKWGVGYDNIAIETAREVGVRVLRTTGSNALPVAETAVGLMLALQRSIILGHDDMQAGLWRKGEIGGRTFTLSGKTIGLIGMGPIGQTVARLLKGFGCRLLYTKPTPLPASEADDLGVQYVTLPTLLAEADLVSLHCALTPTTRNLIDAAAIAAMRDGALLVNTSRGGIVVETAVADAIRQGKLRGAAFDVFDAEPIQADHPLLGLPNVILTPHIASQAVDTYAPTVSRMLNNLTLLAQGQTLPAGDIVV